MYNAYTAYIHHNILVRKPYKPKIPQFLVWQQPLKQS